VLVIPFAALSAATVWIVAQRRSAQNAGRLAIAVVLWLAAIRVSRLDAFFAIAAVMLIVPFGAGGANVHAVRARLNVRRRDSFAVAAAACLMVAIGGLLTIRAAECVEVRGAPEPAAVRFFEVNSFQGNVLTWFDWGQYAIGHLAPRVKVSMDGRRETVYSDDLFDSHMRLYRNEAGATELVSRLNPDAIWLPTGAGVIAVLRAEGWRVVFDGPVSTIMLRDSRPVVSVSPDWPASGDRCYPQP
jgi:hypothetical protein